MRKSKWVLWTIAGLLLLVLAYLGAKAAKLDANLITALITAVAAGFAGWSAWLSSRAASESSATARNAMRALSFATKPTLRIRLFNYGERDERPMLIIENVSLHAVTHGIVRWRLRDGTRGSHEFQSIEKLNVPWDNSRTDFAPHERVDISPNLWGVTGKDTITVDYWGEHGTTGWRATWEGDWTFTQDGQYSTMGASLGVTADEELTTTA